MYPFIHLAEGLEIPSFFLVISLVLSISLFWVARRGEFYRLPKKHILDLSLLLMASALIGARVLHITYENWDYYVENPERVFYLWEGGFVFYGGMIAAFGAAFAYLRWIRAPEPGLYYDAFAPVLSFAYGFGRIGCFLAGCCYGRFCEYPWAIGQKHPTQLYALLWEVGCILLLLGLDKKNPRERLAALSKPGNLFVLWLGLYGIGRILMEYFRDDFRGAEIFGLSVSTVGSVFLILGAALYLGRSFSRRTR